MFTSILTFVYIPTLIFIHFDIIILITDVDIDVDVDIDANFVVGFMVWIKPMTMINLKTSIFVQYSQTYSISDALAHHYGY